MLDLLDRFRLSEPFGAFRSLWSRNEAGLSRRRPEAGTLTGRDGPAACSRGGLGQGVKRAVHQLLHEGRGAGCLRILQRSYADKHVLCLQAPVHTRARTSARTRARTRTDCPLETGVAQVAPRVASLNFIRC